MDMFILMVIVFILGYTAIALEHPLKVNKAASALLTGVLTWVILVLAYTKILTLGPDHNGFSPSWHHYLESTDYQDFLKNNPDSNMFEIM